MLLASIYNTSEENIRLHADNKENPIVEVYVSNETRCGRRVFICMIKC